MTNFDDLFHPCVQLFFRSLVPEPREDLGREKGRGRKGKGKGKKKQVFQSSAPCDKMIEENVPSLGRRRCSDRSSSSSDWSFEEPKQERKQERRTAKAWIVPHTSIDQMSAR